MTVNDWPGDEYVVIKKKANLTNIAIKVSHLTLDNLSFHGYYHSTLSVLIC